MKSDDTDNTTGQIKHVRGSGPAMLSVEGTMINFNDKMFLLSWNTWQPALPQPCVVIGIDLTRRTIRLQLRTGKEFLYTAEQNTGGSSCFLFAEDINARENAIKLAKAYQQRTDKAADMAIAAASAARELVDRAENWTTEID